MHWAPYGLCPALARTAELLLCSARDPAGPVRASLLLGWLDQATTPRIIIKIIRYDLKAVGKLLWWEDAGLPVMPGVRQPLPVPHILGCSGKMLGAGFSFLHRLSAFMSETGIIVLRAPRCLCFPSQSVACKQGRMKTLQSDRPC